MTDPGEREVILEYFQIGNSVKVSAVDPVTLVEVSIIGPADQSREALTRTAINKLDYVLRKMQDEQQSG